MGGARKLSTRDRGVEKASWMAAKRRGAKNELEHWLAMQCRLMGSFPPPLAAGDGSASQSCAGKHSRRGALGARFEPILTETTFTRIGTNSKRPPLPS